MATIVIVGRSQSLFCEMQIVLDIFIHTVHGLFVTCSVQRENHMYFFNTVGKLGYFGYFVIHKLTSLFCPNWVCQSFPTALTCIS